MSYSEIKQNCKGYYSDFEVKIQDGGMVFRKKKRVFFDKGLSEKGRLRQLKLLHEKFIEDCQEEFDKERTDEDNIRLSKYIDMYLEEVRITKSNSQYTNYKTQSKVIKEQLGNLKLKDIRPIHIQKFFNYIATIKKKPNYILPKDNFNELIKGIHFRARDFNKISQGHFKNMRKAKLGLKVSYKWAIDFSEYINRPLDFLFKEPIIEDYSYDMKKRYIMLLRTCLKDAKRKLYINENYASSDYTTFIKNVHYNKKMNVFKIDEIKKLYNYIVNLETSKIKLLFMLLISTGARKEEILGLKWEDIVEECDLIKINRTVTTGGFGIEIKEATKTKSSTREIRISKEVMDELMKYKKIVKYSNDDVFLFTKDDGLSVVHPSYVNDRLNVILKKLEIPHRGVHAIRHTFASIMINKLPLAEVSSILGHSQISTTLNFYTHQITRDKPDTFIQDILE